MIEEGIPTFNPSIESEWGDMPNMSELKKPPGRPRKKDWEMKILNAKDWVFNNSYIDEDSKKEINKEISKFIEAIRRYKNQN